MPLIVRQGDETQGHCWSKAPLGATQTNVTVHGSPVVRLGDQATGGVHPLTCNHGTTAALPNHVVQCAQGSPNVFVEGISVVRDADPMACGDAADTPTGVFVTANGGGNASIIFPNANPAAISELEFGLETLSYVVMGITDSYSFNLEGKIKYTYNSFGLVDGEEWEYWTPTALEPKNPNGFVVTLSEEDPDGGGPLVSRTFNSLRGVGAPDLPSVAPQIYKDPLDQFVSYVMISGPFTIDPSSGAVTLNPNFVPPKNPNDPTRFARRIPIEVKIKYSNGIIFEDIRYEIPVTYTKV